MIVQQKFALFFTGGEVQILTSDTKVAEWTCINSIHIEDPELQETMLSLRENVLAATNGQNLVSVFLSEPDIFVSEVSILGRSKVAQQRHVNRTLARRTGDRAENIVSEIGVVAADKSARVVYAALDTLSQAQDFLSQYGLDAAYFSTRYVPEGFAKEPRLLSYLPEPPKLRPTRAKVVQRAYVGTVAAMTCATVLLFGNAPDQRVGFPEVSTQAMSVYSTRLQNLDYQPKAILGYLPYAQAMPSSGQFKIGKSRPRDLSVEQNVVLATLNSGQKNDVAVLSDAIVDRSLPVQNASYSYGASTSLSGVSLSITGIYDVELKIPTNDPWVSPNLLAHNIEPSTPSFPDPEDIRKLDALLKGGLFVSIGRLKNLTLANDASAVQELSGDVLVEAQFSE